MWALTSTSQSALELVAEVADWRSVVLRNTCSLPLYSSQVRNFSCSAWKSRTTSPCGWGWGGGHSHASRLRDPVQGPVPQTQPDGPHELRVRSHRAGGYCAQSSTSGLRTPTHLAPPPSWHLQTPLMPCPGRQEGLPLPSQSPCPGPPSPYPPTHHFFCSLAAGGW